MNYFFFWLKVFLEYMDETSGAGLLTFFIIIFSYIKSNVTRDEHFGGGMAEESHSLLIAFVQIYS